MGLVMFLVSSRSALNFLAIVFGLWLQAKGELPQNFPYCSDQYIIYSREATILRKSSVAVGGNVGSAKHVVVEERAQVWGTVTADSNAWLHKNSLVNGLVTVGGQVFRGHGSKVASDVIEHMPGWEECPIPQVLDIPVGTHDVFVHKHPKILGPGTYRYLRVLPRSILTLRSGTYNFQGFWLDGLASVALDLSDGPIQINVEKNVSIGREAEITPIAGDSNMMLTIYSKQNHQLCIGSFAGVSAIFVAPKADIILGDSVELDGRLFGKKVIVGRGSGVYMPAAPVTAVVAQPPVLPVIKDSAAYFDSLLKTITADQISPTWSTLPRPFLTNKKSISQSSLISQIPPLGGTLEYGVIGEGATQFVQIMQLKWYEIYGNHTDPPPPNPPYTVTSLAASADPVSGVSVVRKVGTFDHRHDGFGYSVGNFKSDLDSFIKARIGWYLFPFEGCWTSVSFPCIRRWQVRICQSRIPSLCVADRPRFRWFQPKAAALAAADAKQIQAAVLRDNMAMRPRRTVWEIGNEPNMFPYISPQDYAVLFREYYKVIKRADPNAEIVIGALFDRDFIKQDAVAHFGELLDEKILDAGVGVGAATFLIGAYLGSIFFPPIIVLAPWLALYTSNAVTSSLDDAKNLVQGTLLNYTTRQYFSLVLSNLDRTVDINGNGVFTPLLPDAISVHYYPFDVEGRYTRNDIITRISNTSAWLSTDLYANRGRFAPVAITEAGNINWELRMDPIGGDVIPLTRMIDILDGAGSPPQNLGTNTNFNVLLLWYKPLLVDPKFAPLGIQPAYTRFIEDPTFDAFKAQAKIDFNGWASFCFDLNVLGREYYRRANGFDCEGASP